MGVVEDGLSHPLGQCYALSMWHRHTQSKTAIRRRLVPHGILLMSLRGSNRPVVYPCGLTVL